MKNLAVFVTWRQESPQPRFCCCRVLAVSQGSVSKKGIHSCTMRALRCSFLDSFSKFKTLWSAVISSPSEVGGEIPSARIRGLCFCIWRAWSWSSRILHDSDPFGKLREHAVISSWFGIVDSLSLFHLFQLRELLWALVRGSTSASVSAEGDLRTNAPSCPLPSYTTSTRCKLSLQL